MLQLGTPSKSLCCPNVLYSSVGSGILVLESVVLRLIGCSVVYCFGTAHGQAPSLSTTASSTMTPGPARDATLPSRIPHMPSSYVSCGDPSDSWLFQQCSTCRSLLSGHAFCYFLVCPAVCRLCCVVAVLSLYLCLSFRMSMSAFSKHCCSWHSGTFGRYTMQSIGGITLNVAECLSWIMQLSIALIRTMPPS